MKKFIIILLFLLPLTTSTLAQEARVLDDGVYLKDYTLSQLQNEFKELAYDEFLNPAHNSYPRVFVQNIPSDLDSLENKTIRNQLFMQIVLPHVLKINDELKLERQKLLTIKEQLKTNNDLDKETCQYLEEEATRYDVTTHFKDSRRCIKLLNELLERVDTVPPSLVVGAAAIYTKWGTSRIAVEGNNLYKMRNWYTEEGLKPIGEDENEPYRYKIYPSIEDSIRDYIFRINTSINYQAFRYARKISHKRGDILYGKRLVWSLVTDTNLQNFAGLLDYTITFYRLTFFDEATLWRKDDFIN